MEILDWGFKRLDYWITGEAGYDQGFQYSTLNLFEYYIILSQSYLYSIRQCRV